MVQIGFLARGLGAGEVSLPVGVLGPAAAFSPSLAVVLLGQDYIAAVSEQRGTERTCAMLRIAAARMNVPARVSSVRNGSRGNRHPYTSSTVFSFPRGN